MGIVCFSGLADLPLGEECVQSAAFVCTDAVAVVAACVFECHVLGYLSRD